MDKYKEIPHDKADLKDLENYLRKHELIDERNLWFAGFPYNEGAQQNAIAGNLFYGNKRLKIVAVKGDYIHFIHNAKDHFSVYKYGTVNDKYNIIVKRKILHPTIEMYNEKDDRISLQINQNKDKVFEFRKLVK